MLAERVVAELQHSRSALSLELTFKKRRPLPIWDGRPLFMTAAHLHGTRCAVLEKP